MSNEITPTERFLPDDGSVFVFLNSRKMAKIVESAPLINPKVEFSVDTT